MEKNKNKTDHLRCQAILNDLTYIIGVTKTEERENGKDEIFKKK